MADYNVLYMICHDLSEHLACYGYRYVESPNLDRMAAEGVRFSNAFLASTPCSPARGCIQTGMFAHNNGQTGLAHRGFVLPDEQRTIVDELNDAGVETYHFGHQHEREPRDSNPNRYRHDWVQSHDSKKVCAKVVEFLENRKPGSGRFYLNAGFGEVHLPYVRDQYELKEGPDDVALPPYLPDTPTMRRELANFNAPIRYMDQAIAPVLDALERTGHAEDTLFMFTTDHGMALPRCKSTLYDSGTKVALLVKPPTRAENMLRPAVIDELVSAVDIMPTLLDVIGVKVPEYVQGSSFLPLSAGDNSAARTEVFMEKNVHEHYDPTRSIRTKRFRYVRSFDKVPYLVLPADIVKSIASDELPAEWFDERAAEELYDLEMDPHEVRNVSGVRAYSDVLSDLRARLDAWMQETNDPVARGEKIPFPKGARMSLVPPIGYHTGKYGNVPELTDSDTVGEEKKER